MDRAKSQFSVEICRQILESIRKGATHPLGGLTLIPLPNNRIKIAFDSHSRKEWIAHDDGLIDFLRVYREEHRGRTIELADLWADLEQSFGGQNFGP